MKEKTLGKLFVITGPSGVGKDSIVAGLKSKLPIKIVTTTTSRKPRSGRERIYHYVDDEEFKDLIRRNKLLEWARVYENYYGSTKEEVTLARENSIVAILEVDPQGAKALKKIVPDCISIFIAPKILDDLKERLISRGKDTQEVIDKRLKVAKRELKNLTYYDFVVINEQGKLKKAVNSTYKIIKENL